MDQPTAEEMLRELEPLLGEWTIQAGPPDGEPRPGEFRTDFDMTWRRVS